MPTPFTHLEIAQRLLRDTNLSTHIRSLLSDQVGPFLLGSVAADARVGAKVPREETHFYAYGEDIVDHPWRMMMRKYPDLLHPHDNAHRVFVAGYVAHLAVDEIWSRYMVAPHFAGREWGERAFRFYMLHIILIYMDERDLTLLEDWQADQLKAAEPDNWLPFTDDDSLRAWQTLIYEQIVKDGKSRTLEIFGGRIGKEPAEMRAFLDSPSDMQAGLWDHISPDILAQTEARMYAHARDQLTIYLHETDKNGQLTTSSENA